MRVMCQSELMYPLHIRCGMWCALSESKSEYPPNDEYVVSERVCFVCVPYHGERQIDIVWSVSLCILLEFLLGSEDFHACMNVYYSNHR